MNSAVPTEAPAIPPPDAHATVSATPATIPPESAVVARGEHDKPCAICEKPGHTAFAHVARHSVRVMRVDSDAR